MCWVDVVSEHLTNGLHRSEGLRDNLDYLEGFRVHRNLVHAWRFLFYASIGKIAPARMPWTLRHAASKK